jgi:hypothetical protein
VICPLIQANLAYLRITPSWSFLLQIGKMANWLEFTTPPNLPKRFDGQCRCGTEPAPQPLLFRGHRVDLFCRDYGATAKRSYDRQLGSGKLGRGVQGLIVATETAGNRALGCTTIRGSDKELGADCR